MNLIIPMAGQGKRLRPHTLNKPKTLLSIAGSTIIERILLKIRNNFHPNIEEIGFIVNEIDKNVVDILTSYTLKFFGYKAQIYVQDNPLGTAHAIYQANKLLNKEVLIAFSDTLFEGNLKINKSFDGIIWCKEVNNPSAFGVVKIDRNKLITDIIEKPQTQISNQAIIGLYYFKDGSSLKIALEELLNSRCTGEYQFTDALTYLIKKNNRFTTVNVDEWMDCGNKGAIINAHKILLKISKDENIIKKGTINNNSLIIPPVYLGENIVISNSIVGPYASIGNNTNIYDSRIQNTIVQDHTNIRNSNLNDAILGSYVNFERKPTTANIGDYSNISII